MYIHTGVYVCVNKKRESHQFESMDEMSGYKVHRKGWRKERKGRSDVIIF